MATIAQAVISREAGAPTRVEEMVVEDPGPGEVLVRIQASGVCHTDLHYKLGKINNDFPFLLGHEVAGIVESVGEGVESPGVGAVCGDRLEGALRQLPVLRYRAAAFVLGEPECETQNVRQRVTGSCFRPRWVSGGFARIPSYRLSRLSLCLGNARLSRLVCSAVE